MFLVIDIGNTNQKAALFDDKGCQISFIQQITLTVSNLQTLIGQHNLHSAILSSVGNMDSTVLNWLEHQVRLIQFSTNLPLPLQIQYESAGTLGTDRIACAVAANAMFPNQNVLSIQAGTCLVTDFVDSTNTYLGGSISPGLQMRFHALHEHTAHLPLLEPQTINSFTGNSTQNSILSGVINGLSCEIDGFIGHYLTHYPDTVTILTGGDAPLLQNYIKNRIFAAPNLVLQGLYKILRYNTDDLS